MDPLLANIAAHPEDLDARLVYSDWCEEHGRLARAELIRTQLHLDRHPPRRELITEVPPRWMPPHPDREFDIACPNPDQAAKIVPGEVIHVRLQARDDKARVGEWLLPKVRVLATQELADYGHRGHSVLTCRVDPDAPDDPLESTREELTRRCSNLAATVWELEDRPLLEGVLGPAGPSTRWYPSYRGGFLNAARFTWEQWCAGHELVATNFPPLNIYLWDLPVLHWAVLPAQRQYEFSLDFTPGTSTTPVRVDMRAFHATRDGYADGNAFGQYTRACQQCLRLTWPRHSWVVDAGGLYYGSALIDSVRARATLFHADLFPPAEKY